MNDINSFPFLVPSPVLARDASSKVIRLRQVNNEYAPLPPPVPHSRHRPIASLLKRNNKELSAVLASATSPECDVDVHVLSPPVLAVQGGGVDIDYVWGRCTHDDVLEKKVHHEIL